MMFPDTSTLVEEGTCPRPLPHSDPPHQSIEQSSPSEVATSSHPSSFVHHSDQSTASTEAQQCGQLSPSLAAPLSNPSLSLQHNDQQQSVTAQQSGQTSPSETAPLSNPSLSQQSMTAQCSPSVNHSDQATEPTEAQQGIEQYSPGEVATPSHLSLFVDHSDQPTAPTEEKPSGQSPTSEAAPLSNPSLSQQSVTQSSPSVNHIDQAMEPTKAQQGIEQSSPGEVATPSHLSSFVDHSDQPTKPTVAQQSEVAPLSNPTLSAQSSPSINHSDQPTESTEKCNFSHKRWKNENEITGKRPTNCKISKTQECDVCLIIFDSRASFIEHCISVHKLRFKTSNGYLTVKRSDDVETYLTIKRSDDVETLEEDHGEKEIESKGKRKSSTEDTRMGKTAKMEESQSQCFECLECKRYLRSSKPFEHWVRKHPNIFCLIEEKMILKTELSRGNPRVTLKDVGDRSEYQQNNKTTLI